MKINDWASFFIKEDICLFGTVDKVDLFSSVILPYYFSINYRSIFFRVWYISILNSFIMFKFFFLNFNISFSTLAKKLSISLKIMIPFLFKVFYSLNLNYFQIFINKISWNTNVNFDVFKFCVIKLVNVKLDKLESDEVISKIAGCS